MAEQDPPQAPQLNMPEKVAVFLMTVGEEHAAEILRHLEPKEVQVVGHSMANLNNISIQQVEDVVEEFVDEVGGKTALGIGSDDYIRKMMTQALGEDKAGAVIDRILLGRNSKGIEALRWMEPRAIAEIIRLEHPQIIAIVLTHLEPDQAAEVLSYLPERGRSDVIMRISTLDSVQPQALQELDQILEKQFSGGESVQSSAVGGKRTAAEILNFLDTSSEGPILEAISDVDSELAQSLQDLMFVFDNLADVDDRGIQALMREVSTEQLVLALKGADDAVKQKIFKNMSKRAAEMLQDDLEAKGPVRLSEVEAAQKEIIAIARRMAENGDIVLGGKGDEMI